MNKQTLRVGTRGSQLALYQAELTKKILLENFPGLNVEIIVIQTKGDKILDVAPFSFLFHKKEVSCLIPILERLPYITQNFSAYSF